MDNIQLDSFEVQAFLDGVKAGQVISVRFIKQDGSVASYNGTLDVNASRSRSVAILTDDGWKRFSVERVIQIEGVE